MADDDRDIIEHIDRLVDEEHLLDGHHAAGTLGDEQRIRRRDLEVQLDQLWDLLRQRRARRSVGEDPDRATVRDADTVERYRQ